MPLSKGTENDNFNGTMGASTTRFGDPRRRLLMEPPGDEMITRFCGFDSRLMLGPVIPYPAGMGTKRFYGFNSQSVLGPVIPKMLKMGVVPACMVLMMK